MKLQRLSELKIRKAGYLVEFSKRILTNFILLFFLLDNLL